MGPAASPMGGMPLGQPQPMLGPDIMALVDDVISPSLVEETFVPVPETSPATPVDTLKSDSEDSPPAETEPPAAEAGDVSDTSGGDMSPAGAPKGDEDHHTDGELTAYQALLSGAYLRDLVSMQAKEHSTFAWVNNLIDLIMASLTCDRWSVGFCPSHDSPTFRSRH